jgi:hypothetical protein
MPRRSQKSRWVSGFLDVLSGSRQRPTSWAACFVWIFLRLGGVVRDRIQNAGRPGCVWRDAKHRVRDARVPRKHRRSIGSTENVEEAVSVDFPRNSVIVDRALVRACSLTVRRLQNRP